MPLAVPGQAGVREAGRTAAEASSYQHCQQQDPPGVLSGSPRWGYARQSPFLKRCKAAPPKVSCQGTTPH